MKKNEIILKRGMAKEIAELLNITRQTVYKALRGDESVRYFDKIRKIAQEKLEKFNQ